MIPIDNFCVIVLSAHVKNKVFNENISFIQIKDVLF